MDWTPEIEQRFTELRLRQLSGDLAPLEQRELVEIRAAVEKIETESVAPVFRKLESEQAALQKALDGLQAENDDLTQLFNQQALLISDTQEWLEQFERRYSVIQKTFSRLIGQSVAV